MNDRHPVSELRTLVARLLATSALLLLAACGDDGDSGLRTNTIGRFCDLYGQLEELAVSSGASSAIGTFDGPAESFRGLVEGFETSLDDMALAAPDDIDGDVDSIIESLRDAAGGDVAGVQSQDFGEARAKVQAFRSTSCPEGGTSGDG